MEINKPVATIIILIITLIVIFLFVVPKFQESSDLQTKLFEKQSEYNGESVYYAKISELLSGISERKDVFEKVNSALPSDFSFASLVYFLQKKVSETGLVAKSLTFLQISPTTYGQAHPAISGQALPENSQKGVRDISFNMDLVGNYQGLKNFLSSLEKSARLFEVDTVSFSSLQSLQGSTQSQNQSQIYDFKLSLKTHTY